MTFIPLNAPHPPQKKKNSPKGPTENETLSLPNSRIIYSDEANGKLLPLMTPIYGHWIEP